MTLYERLEAQYPFLIIREDRRMPKGLSGLYYDNHIRINSQLPLYEKTGILAEELGHYETTYGDIVDFQDVSKRKLEEVARRWGYLKIVSFDRLVECYEAGHRTLEDIGTYLEITPPYLKNALDFYGKKHGLYQDHKGYRITFDPFDIHLSQEIL